MTRATTSASNIHRRVACPGSERLEAGLPDEDSALSEEGQLLHSFDANPSLDRSTLKPQQQDLLRISGELDDFVFSRVSEQFGISSDEPFEESRAGETWWVTRDGENNTPGHTDRYKYWPARKLLCVIDTKYGFLEVEPASANYQLRCYACAGAEKFDVTDVAVAICQPRLSFDRRVTLAAYNLDDIEASRKELFAIRDACLAPDAPLHASLEACRYCKAKAGCPAFTSQLAQVSDAVESGKRHIGTLGQLTVTQRDGLITACKFADYIKESVYDFERAVIQSGGESLYTLGKASEVRKIIDPKRAVSLLTLRGDLTKDEVLDCCSPKIGALEEKLREKKKCTWSEAKKTVEETLAPVIEKEAKKPSLTRVKT